VTRRWPYASPPLDEASALLLDAPPDLECAACSMCLLRVIPLNPSVNASAATSPAESFGFGYAVLEEMRARCAMSDASGFSCGLSIAMPHSTPSAASPSARTRRCGPRRAVALRFAATLRRPLAMFGTPKTSPAAELGLRRAVRCGGRICGGPHIVSGPARRRGGHKRFRRNSLGSAGAVGWRNVVIEPEEVVRVVLPLHRLQAS
jgi:hypothetical protein